MRSRVLTLSRRDDEEEDGDHDWNASGGHHRGEMVAQNNVGTKALKRSREGGIERRAL